MHALHHHNFKYLYPTHCRNRPAIDILLPPPTHTILQYSSYDIVGLFSKTWGTVSVCSTLVTWRVEFTLKLDHYFCVLDSRVRRVQDSHSCNAWLGLDWQIRNFQWWIPKLTISVSLTGYFNYSGCKYSYYYMSGITLCMCMDDGYQLLYFAKFLTSSWPK